MSINGIGTEGYSLSGYKAKKAGRSAESGAMGFMEMVEEKVAQGKAADQDEKAFEMVGRGAPQEVKDAWMDAAKEVNALYDLEHPVVYTPRSIEAQQARIKEGEFYRAFLERLEKL